MIVTTTIDPRCPSLAAGLPGPTTQRELALGDALISSSAAAHLVKVWTWYDLCASLTDSRYELQRAKLLEWRESAPSRTVTYVIENATVPCVNGTTGKMPNESAFAALTSAAMDDFFICVWASSASDTAHHVSRMAQVMGTEDEPLATPGRGLDEAGLQMMLLTLPTVSAAAAAVLARRFKSVARLVRALDSMSTSSRLKMLSTLPVTQKRRVGLAVAHRVSSVFTR